MTRPPLGLVGFGPFGQLTARHLAPHFDILAHDPVATDDLDGLVRLTDLKTAAACPVVILAVPVEALEATVAAMAPDLAPGALVLDVGSVKTRPAAIMAKGLPVSVQVVGTHPLFGPQSGWNGIAGLRIAICAIRGNRAAGRVAAFCRLALGLRVFRVSPEDHDREAATVQGLTHLIARVLMAMEPLPTRMTTGSFELLMQAVELVRYDSPAVFRAIERDNPFAAGVRERFFDLAEQARADLDH